MNVMSDHSARHLDVLFVGAGPIELALACHLRHLGFSVHLIRNGQGCACTRRRLASSTACSEVVARLGVVDRLLAESGSPTTVNLHAGNKRLLPNVYRLARPCRGVRTPQLS